MENKIKVLLVDDHNLITKLLDSMLQQHNDIEVVSTQNDGNSAIEYIKSNKVDVILLDIDMPGKDGIETLREIHKIDKRIKVIMMTNHKEAPYIKRALNNGAIGYLTKFCQSNEVIPAIKKAYNTKKSFSSDIIDEGILNRLNEYENDFYEKLTDREIQIIKMICKGEKTRQIADKLCISIRTVETHRKNIMHKLEVSNTAELVKKALELHIAET